MAGFGMPARNVANQGVLGVLTGIGGQPGASDPVPAAPGTDWAGIQAYLDSLQQPQGQSDSSGDGSGGDPIDYAALAAARASIEAAHGVGIHQIDDAHTQLMQQYAQLTQQQDQRSAALGQTVQGDLAQRQSNFTSALDPVLADLQKQGFTSSGIQQSAALDQQRLADQSQRQKSYLDMLNGVSQREMTDRQAGAGQITLGAKGKVDLAQFQANAALDAQVAAARNGSGGGGGRGSGSSSDILPAGVAADAASLTQDLAQTNDVREGAQVATGNSRMDKYLQAMLYGSASIPLKHVMSQNGSQVANVASTYINHFAAKFAGKNSDGGKTITKGESNKIRTFTKAAQAQTRAVQANRKKLTAKQEQQRQKGVKLGGQGY